jgi:C4-type Zn-finger protein
MTRYEMDCTMEPADNGDWVRFDEVEVILQRADEALSMAADLDDKTITNSERQWIIEQIESVHHDITEAVALQETQR